MKTTTSSNTGRMEQPPGQTPSHAAEEAALEVAEEAALAAAHDAVRPKRRRVWPWVLVAEAVILGLCYLAMPLFTTHLSFDKEAMDAQEAIVQERAKAYKIKEESERAKREIQEEHRDSLKKQERAKRRKEVAAHAKELEGIAERMREKRDEQLAHLMEVSPEKDLPSVRTQLDEALEKLAEGSDAIQAFEELKDKEPYRKAVKELVAKADDLKLKANEPAGLNTQDREAMSAQLTHAQTALEKLKEANRDPQVEPLGSGLEEAQTMVDLLRGVPWQMQQLQRQQQFADGKLGQQRDLFQKQIESELDLIKRHHKGLLAQKGRSPEVKKLADRLDTMQQTTQDQKAKKNWDQAELDRAFEELRDAANGVKDHIQDIHDLGDQRQTQGLAGTIYNNQRQANHQKFQWGQLSNKHTQEDKRSDQAVTQAIGKVKSQWKKTREKLASPQQAEHEKSLGKLLKVAEEHAKTQVDATTPPMPAKTFKAEATALAEAIKQTAADDQQEAERLRKELENLANQVAKDEQTAQKHTRERDDILSRIQREWQGSQKQLNDKAARISDALKLKTPRGPIAKNSDPKVAKIRIGLETLAAQTERMQSEGGPKRESVSQVLAERSKTLVALRQDALSLYQTQRQMQNGIARDETVQLDRNLDNLARNLGRKGGDVARQKASYAQTIARHEATLQQSLDRLSKTGAEAAKSRSANAKAIAKTLSPVPDTAHEVLADPTAWQAFQGRVNQAQEQASQWYAKATAQAGGSELVVANAREQLRRVSEAMATAGLSRQNVDAATAMLAEPHPEIQTSRLDSLEAAVAATESLYGQILTDFQSLRAAEIAASSGQSFEQMQHLAAVNVARQTAIEVPDANTAIATISDLNSYRKAMDSTVAQTEGLAQKSRTMQRQALGQGDPTLAQALQRAREAARGQQAGTQAHAGGGGDPSGSSSKGTQDTNHQMTFDASPVRAKRLDVDKIKAEALPGRRFTEESQRRGWLYVDTWYVIGPWENLGKVDWTDVHAPEFEIDLAKVYPGGKGGRELRWQFTQNPTIRCVVPGEQNNSTYYAYTEVYFDQPREMLVAIASDDAAKLWIDGKLVWQDEGLSVWNMDEGFRRVHFKQGFSKVLMRIENGPGFCQYSMLLCPPDI